MASQRSGRTDIGSDVAVARYGNYIAGAWVPASSGETFASTNPARRSETIGYFAASNADDVATAVAAASQALPAWRATSPSSRATVLYGAAQWLDARATAIGEQLAREQGKPVGEACTEVRRTAEHLRFFAALGHIAGGHTYPSGEATLLLYSRRFPLGVVAVISPWNFPISIPARKIAPALASGNTVVFKPASLTPLIAVRLVEALEAGGLPAGVCNLVTGKAETVGDPLVADPRVDAVTFTGSTEVGFRIARRVDPTVRTQLEMGGKNALVVLRDADVERAAGLAVTGGFSLAGQACTGTSRIFVEAPVYERFTEALITATSRLRIGPGLDPSTTMGPLVNAAQEARVLSYIETGVSEGARLRCGGAKLTGPSYDDGYFVEPAIFTDVAADARILHEEIFGPVLAVRAFDDLGEAIALVNDVDYGLVASVCTNDLARAYRFVEESDVGMVKVNRTTTGVAMNAPFGGWKNSSTATFREEGVEAIEFFTKTKTVFMGAD